MASGKTTVGRAVADRLGWGFLDFDVEIERETGRSVARIFSELGEPAFRRLESKIGREALARDRVVLASGGGWAAHPGHMDRLPPGTLTVWLQVDPRVAVERARAEGTTRPLLAGEDPMQAASALSLERDPLYARARLHLDTVGASPDTLAAAIVKAVDAPDGAP
jgi:shikimate kinase